MPAPVKITRTDRTSRQLHRYANKCKDRIQARRVRALAMVVGGKLRSEAADAVDVTLQTIRDWVIRYNRWGVAGLRDARRSGRPSLLSKSQTKQLWQWIVAGPDIETDGVSRWRVVDLVRLVKQRFGIVYSVDGLRRKLHSMGFRWITARPVHPQSSASKKREFRETFAQIVAKELPAHATNLPLEIWFQDETRHGQIGTLERIWAVKGKRTRVVRDFRFKYRWLFGSACASRGKAVGHVSKRCNTQETNIHLADVSKAVAAGCHGVLVLDGVSYHRSKGLVVPDNLTLIHLPPYSPELNPMEQVWDWLKSNFLRNRVHRTEDDVQTAMTQAWQRFANDPDRIASIMTRTWANA